LVPGPAGLVAVDQVLELQPAVDLVAVDQVLELQPAVDLVAVDLVAVDLVAVDLVPGPWAAPPGARALVPGPWCLQMRMRLIHGPRGRGPKKRAGSLAARASALFYAVDFT
jgi:hypothetical protein